VHYRQKGSPVVKVVILSLGDATCGCDGDTCGARTEVLACRDALQTSGAEVVQHTAHTDAAIDEALAWNARLVVATAADGQLRAVVRRLVRRYAPAASQRPDDLPAGRTVYDLPPLGVLPLGPASDDLPARLGLPRSPVEVAAAVLGGTSRRLDLLRTDSGSVTLDGALLGGADDSGRAVPFHARVEVDDQVLSDGTEPVLVAAVANASGYTSFDGLPLVTDADSSDGRVDVAVALPSVVRAGLFRAREVQVEVRRSSGRAVVVVPRDETPFVDDGVAGTLDRKRTWWLEAGAWAVYTG
jgi:diacylglycerol kinase family enzyme